MARRYYALIIMGLLSVVMIHSVIQAKKNKNIQMTEVISYQPKIPSSKPLLGSCWTNSLAANRPNAWRCMVDNTIYDPCFTTTTKDLLVCNPNPLNPSSEIALQLTKPLPAPTQITPKANEFWMLLLTDGSICQQYTGTIPVIENISIPYYCVNPRRKLAKNCYEGLIANSVEAGTVWHAKEVYYCETSPGVLKAHHANTVAINTVWQ